MGGGKIRGQRPKLVASEEAEESRLVWLKPKEEEHKLWGGAGEPKVFCEL